MYKMGKGGSAAGNKAVKKPGKAMPIKGTSKSPPKVRG